MLQPLSFAFFLSTPDPSGLTPDRPPGAQRWIYTLFCCGTHARTPAEPLHQTRRSNREKGITQREIHSLLDYLAVNVELHLLGSDSGFLSDGVLVVWLMDSTSRMVARRYVSPFSACHCGSASAGSTRIGMILLSKSRDFPRMDPAAFPCPRPSVAALRGLPSPAALVFIHNFPRRPSGCVLSATGPVLKKSKTKENLKMFS